MLRNFKVILAVLVVLVLAGGAYAFAASNGVQTQIAGDGMGAVSGVDITSVVYTMNVDQSKLDEVQFTVTPKVGIIQPAGVEIKLNPSGTWYTCLNQETPADLWKCSTVAETGQITMADVTQLRVAAHTNATFSTTP